MKSSFLVFLLAVAASMDLSAQGVLHYELLPDSTVTPHDGATPTGPSEALTGSFSWSPVFPSGIVDSMQFDITSLIFSSPSYFLTLNNSSQPDNITKIGPDGGTALNAYVIWQGAPQNPYFIGGFGQGTYLGSAAAPSQLMLTEGLGPSAGGSFVAYVYIDAQLVPEPPTCSLLALAFCGLLVLEAHRKRTTVLPAFAMSLSSCGLRISAFGFGHLRLSPKQVTKPLLFESLAPFCRLE